MPTATETMTVKGDISGHAILPLKAGPGSSKVSVTTSIEATLRSLYNRAARAFLHRDIQVTFTLLNSAFSMLRPPTEIVLDNLDSHRRKWDILRITLETTVYSSPPDVQTLPPPLRANMLLSPQSFITSLHTRSLTLFTPSPLSNPNSAFLPHQVLVTLAASSLKIACPEVGRGMMEDWLSRRGQYDAVSSDGEAYEKVLELYCLHVLPRLREWNYVKEFLQYETELRPEKKHDMQVALTALKDNADRDDLSSTSKSESTITAPLPSRTPSPASSASSSTSSSISTVSNRTAVPSSRIEPAIPRELKRRDSIRSSASDATITKRTSRQYRTPTPRGSPSASAVRSLRPPRPPLIESPRESPGALTLIKASLKPYFAANKLMALSILFFLLPLISFLFRIRRRREAGGTGSAADHVRRQLLDARSDSLLRRLWNEGRRAVTDTVRMGGGGLV
ncbi:hypothetical protein BJ138DRAFT_1179807 [Hygrophoropsis aurantiaca]|uniref:Uncharacterized protein n=1 Tax=Hygrophoropsis aurantiaca TaxID=72124 RepID=A0ACB8ADB7_9AGAM|nr:hypothetical protein BJ138DRAFT_1179807 [Hygrophoropsis aurantiaca]